MCLRLHKGYESKNLSAVMTRVTLSFCFVFSFLFFGGCFFGPGWDKLYTHDPSRQNRGVLQPENPWTPQGQIRQGHLDRASWCAEKHTARTHREPIHRATYSLFWMCRHFVVVFYLIQHCSHFHKFVFHLRLQWSSQLKTNNQKKNLIAPQKMSCILSVYVE